MKPFEPADGETARWRKVYELVLTKEVNDEITYREVEDLIEANRHAAYAAMRDAKRHLEQEGQQSVRTVPSFGWVVMRAAEHIDESDRHLRKSNTQAKIALRTISAIDSRRGELSQEQRQAADRNKLRALAVENMTGRRRRSLDELYGLGEQKQIS